MSARAEAHRSERGQEFHTLEEPLDLARAVGEAGSHHRVVVIDCLTLWLSNLMHHDRDIEAESAAFLATALASPATVIAVTNEVGCGIISDNELSRRFRDEAGRLNQRIAAAASEVYWMAFGLSLRMK
jgi:adenosylcobinamide kinase/adenosylcobinamide-phosphate guanylyltransferase